MFHISTRSRAWIVVAMMFLFMMINFADKAIIGLAAVPMMHDLGLTPQQLGLVGSSFFLLFSTAGVLFGFAANRIKTKWLLAVLALTWALVQFPLVGTVSFPLLIVCRILLGAGEGPAYPLAIHATYKWFDNLMIGEVTPTRQRAAWLGINASLGTLAGLITPALMGHFVGDTRGITEGFSHGFAVLGCILVPCGLLGIWLLDPERSVRRLQRFHARADSVRDDLAATTSGHEEAA